MAVYTAPIDEVHEMSAVAITRIRMHIKKLHEEVARWEPRPLPRKK